MMAINDREEVPDDDKLKVSDEGKYDRQGVPVEGSI
jgi:hypothetical protein